MRGAFCPAADQLTRSLSGQYAPLLHKAIARVQHCTFSSCSFLLWSDYCCFDQLGQPILPIMQLEARLCQRCLWCCRTALRTLCLSPAHRSTVNHYDLLGVKPNASIEEIKNAFFDKSKKMHPDSDPSNPGLHGQFVALSEAYRVLSREPSRREYDLRLRHAYSPASSSTHSPRAEPQESVRYWEQFRRSAPPREFSAEERERLRRRNARLVGYCLLTMGLSIGAHVLFFRKLEEVHNNFMDEKDKTILKIYNDSKERARVNGFKKQTEILRQKHAEFQQKYKIRPDGEDK